MYLIILALSMTVIGVKGVPLNQSCPANEKYIDCVHADCFRPKTCFDIGKPPNDCIFTTPCNGGCVCNFGFVRNDEGECVLEETCPTAQCRENEKYSRCANSRCSREYCSDIDHSKICRCAEVCLGGCLCKPGYLRHQGVCVRQETCPNACPVPHSHFTACKSACKHTSCYSLSFEIKPNCVEPQPDSDDCDIGCVCDDGYLWEDGLCVRTEQCGMNGAD